MQAFDFLSLFVGLADHTPAPDAESHLFSDIIRTVDHAPGPRHILNVPTAIAAERVELTLTAIEPNVVSVDPYPFKLDEVALSVDTTTIEDRGYADQADARSAIKQGERVTVTCRMVPAVGVTRAGMVS